MINISMVDEVFKLRNYSLTCKFDYLFTKVGFLGEEYPCKSVGLCEIMCVDNGATCIVCECVDLCIHT